MKPSVLDQYIARQEEYKSQIEANSLPLDLLLVMQELNYRIYVLKTCQAFCKTAPKTLDTGVMGFHYQIVEAFIRYLLTERRFGTKTDENGQKQRQTAAEAFMTVFQDSSRRFASFAPKTQDQYKNSIKNMIETILPAWMQYRDSYVKVEFEGRL